MHPTQLRPADLVCALMEGSEDFGRRDGLERAMGALIGAGLLYRSGAVVLPSVAALHFDGMPW